MNSILSIALPLLLFLITLPVTVNAKCAPTIKGGKLGIVMIKSLNLRSQPSMGNNILDKLPKWRRIEVIDSNRHGWLKIHDLTTCTTGWVADQYVNTTLKESKNNKGTKEKVARKEACKLDEKIPRYGKVTINDLNFRSQPVMGNNILGKFTEGKQVGLIEENIRGWVRVIDPASCRTGWIVKRYVKEVTPANAPVSPLKVEKEEPKSVSPLFLTSTTLPSQKEVTPPSKKDRKETKFVPVSDCFRTLKKTPLGYGRVKPLSAEILSAQDVNARRVCSLSQKGLLAILETTIDWFHVVEEKNCATGWIRRFQVTDITLEHPLAPENSRIEPEPLSACLLSLKKGNPIGYGVVTAPVLLQTELHENISEEAYPRLHKEQPVTILRLVENWLEVVEETSCRSGWIRYEKISNITFQRPIAENNNAHFTETR